MMNALRRTWRRSLGLTCSPLRVVPVLLVAGVLAVPGPGRAQERPVSEVRQRIERLRQDGSISISGVTVHRSSILVELYEGAGFAPIWTGPNAAVDLTEAIRDAAADGLDPADYHLAAIEALGTEAGDAAVGADLDILRSDALLRLSHDLRYGKVDQTDPTAGRNLSRPLIALGGADSLRRIVRSGRVGFALAELRPSHFVYRGLTAGLAELRVVEERGGWERIPPGPALRVGSVDPRVAVLRGRLVHEGDFARTFAEDEDVFDLNLETAVKSFQHRHGLNEDGVVGPATLAELNVPVGRRIEQLRVNLERARWLTPDLPDTFVAVNIAGAKVYLVRDNVVVHEARAVVGQTWTRTPVFQATMRYIDLNPTWTVPPGIVHEILANVGRDPEYLGRTQMRVIDRAGRPVQVSAVEISQYSAEGFPYVFRQDPGPANPLGRIKFIFPNSYNVFLHDTPARYLFEKEQRTFSHGCIRVQDPFRLAELILNQPGRWNRDSLLAATGHGTTMTIPLPTPIPVLVLYWTASADLHGELHSIATSTGGMPPC
ncbi:MAG: L,D-transpeptidase family protein [Gemmatimonas sp.]|nr:L,D-transpeptidase family protein [Gemmatimonas sp.]